MVSDSFESVAVDRTRDAKLVEKLKVKWFPTTILVGVNHKGHRQGRKGSSSPDGSGSRSKRISPKAGGNTAKRLGGSERLPRIVAQRSLRTR